MAQGSSIVDAARCGNFRELRQGLRARGFQCLSIFSSRLCTPSTCRAKFRSILWCSCLRLLFLRKLFVCLNLEVLSHSIARMRRKQFKFNRAFARSGHVVRNKLCWDANNAVGLSKQRNSFLSSPTFLYFQSLAQCYLRPRTIYSVPCDRIVQRAYCQLTASNRIRVEYIR